MAVEGCAKFIKYAMFLFNFLIFCGGAALLGVGIWCVADTNAIGSLSALLGTSLYSSAAYVLIACGVIVLVIGFLGCCGAIKESKCMLGTFFALLLIIFIVLMVGAILAFIFQKELTTAVKDKMNSTLVDDYGMDGQKAVTDAWDTLQTTFMCCGVKGNYTGDDSWYKWSSSAWKTDLNNATVFVPTSCCKMAEGEYTNLKKCLGMENVPNAPPKNHPATAENPDMYGTGCYDKTYNTVVDNAVIIGAIAITILVVMILAMIFSICLCRSIED